MLTVSMVTTNRGKFERARQGLEPWDVNVNQIDTPLIEIQGTLEDIAIDKARQAFQIARAPVIVTDAALSIDAFNGWPGVHIKDAAEKLGPAGFLRLMSAFPNQEDRCGSWLESLAYLDVNQAQPRIWFRKDRGCFSREMRGTYHPDMKSPLWTCWEADGYKKTLAEMTEQEMFHHRQTNDGNRMFGEFARWFKRAIE